MRNVDYEYIANSIATLTQIPIRVYKDNQLVIHNDPAHFPQDPADIYIDRLLKVNMKVSYFITEFDHFYGIVRYNDTTMIMGPTFEIPPSRNKIRDFMFLIGVKNNYYELYQKLFYSITPMPIELFLHELCLVYYFISEEKLDLSDVLVYEDLSSIDKQTQKASITKDIATEIYEEVIHEEHTTMDFEKAMLTCVTNGDSEGLQKLFEHNTAGRAGKTASTYLRQLKNIFIASATLLSRAAIAGGLSSQEALSLSDKYIQHSENLMEPDRVMNLQYNMVLDYTNRVAKIKKGTHYDKFMRDITGYILDHLTEDIQVDDIAKALFMSRSYLSTKFRNETGMTLSSYIQELRINKAKDFLTNTDKTILEISTYLGFSSQGYFQNIFKKHTGMTPKEFRGR